MIEKELSDYLDALLDSNPKLNIWLIDCMRDMDRGIMRDLCAASGMEMNEITEFMKEFDKDTEWLKAELLRRQEIADKPYKVERDRNE